MSQQKNGLPVKDYLDALVDKDGLRTEVTITLTDKTLLKTSLYLIGTAFISTMVVYLIKNVMTKT